MRSEMCSLDLTHPSVHTWSSGQPTVQRPGSSHGIPVGAGIRTHNLGLPRVSSPTLYPLGQRLPKQRSRQDIISTCVKLASDDPFNIQIIFSIKESRILTYTMYFWLILQIYPWYLRLVLWSRVTFYKTVLLQIKEVFLTVYWSNNL